MDGALDRAMAASAASAVPCEKRIMFASIDKCGVIDLPPLRENVASPIIVRLYLFGYVGLGGTKTYSPGSLEFRATYVSLLLFRGSYIWIKFRDRRDRGDDESVYGYVMWNNGEKRWEPRYTPRYSEDLPKSQRRVYIGRFEMKDDAEVVLHFAQYYFNAKEPTVKLCNGFEYTIEHVSDQEREDISSEKRARTRLKARNCLRDYKAKLKTWQENIFVDDCLRREQVQQRPNFQNEEVQAEQQHHSPPNLQFLEEENSTLKAKIAENDPTGERRIHYLQIANAALKRILTIGREEHTQTTGNSMRM